MSSNDMQPGSDRPLIGRTAVDIFLSLCILAVALLLGWDSYRTGNKWAFDGPQAGYFPFYLSVLMGAAAIYGLISTTISAVSAILATGEAFVTREQFARVIQVLIPTLAFCILTQVIGLYVSSFLLTAGFMWWTGKIRAWVSVLTALVFTLTMFVTFEVSFHVIMPKGPLETWLGY